MSHITRLILCAVCIFLTPPAPAAPRLNLITIVADDQADWSLGCYGNRESRTPNMDRLAREGARFANAFVCTPVCSPSRAAFFTGRHGVQLGITDWITPKEAKNGLGLPTNAVTWPEVLRAAGYRTALIGKWHLGAQPQFHPTRRGFDHFYGFLAGNSRSLDPELEVNGENQKLSGPHADLLTDEALRFIETNRARPFALQLNFREPHAPYGPVPEEDSAPFQNLDPSIPDFPGLKTAQVKKWTREYYASIHSVDRNLGRLLARLDELKLTGQTIVLFTSDHGYMIGQHGLHMKGNARTILEGQPGATRPNMFEESIRVPLLIRWTGIVQPGRVIAEPVSNLDTFASVLGMLGVAPPRAWKQEGLDFSPLLRGEKYTPRDALYGDYDMHNDGKVSMRMIRTDEWKLVRHHRATGKDELYHLADDPGETRNLFDDSRHEKIRAQLQERLTAWQRSINDPLLREEK